MLFPLPVAPIIAVIVPGFVSNDIFFIVSSSASGYLKLTFLNSTKPFLLSSNFACSDSSFSFIEFSLFNTSAILLKETIALGAIIDSIESIKNAIIICIVYVSIAVISPTCIPPKSIFLEATHTISIQTPFIISVKNGISRAITFLVNNCASVNSTFALSKRFSSYLAVSKALITGSPVKISLDTIFNLSINFCIFWNFGITITKSKIINPIIVSIVTPIIHCIEFPAIFVSAPIPIIGAYNTIRKTIIKSICTC